MMNVLEIIMIAIMFLFALFASLSDIWINRINNKLILSFFIIAIILNGVYYFNNHHLLSIFFYNILLVVILSLLLYAFRIWAAGDCKYIVCLAMFLPAKYYLDFVDVRCSLIIALVISFVLGYMYILISTICDLVKKPPNFNKKKITECVLDLIKRHIFMLIYISFIILVINIVNRCIMNIPIIITSAFAIICSIVVSKLQFFKEKIIIAICIILDISLSIILGIFPIAERWYVYLFVFVLQLVQAFLRQYNYQEINTNDICKGMIISKQSSIQFQFSRIKNLPPISTEDLSSRITYEQAESIKRWGKSKKGADTIYIVKKIPFAIFISLGFFVYCCLGVCDYAYTFV